MPKTTVVAVCPLCQKKWTVRGASLEDMQLAAVTLEEILALGVAYGVVYEVGTTVWWYGNRQARITEMTFSACYEHANHRYAHQIEYTIEVVGTGENPSFTRRNIPWRNLFPAKLSELPRVQRARRLIRPDVENYWSLFPDKIQFHDGIMLQGG